MTPSTSPPSALDYYQAPREVEPRSARDWITTRTQFTVDADRCYNIEVAFNHWTGLEEYWVDGQLLRTTRNLWPWLRERFLLTTTPQTVIEFRCLFFPLSPVRAYINGVPAVHNIFPNLLRNLVAVSFTLGILAGTVVTLARFAL